MVWNLILAIVPLLLSTIALGYKMESWKKVVLLVLWLLFLPNAFYVLTDFIHISDLNYFVGGGYYNFKNVQYNLDIVNYLELVNIAIGYLLSLAAGLISLRSVFGMTTKKYNKKTVTVMLGVVFILIGYAIYIGRFLRLNSWDILNIPHLVEKIVSGMSLFGVTATLLFAGYVAITYVLFEVVSKVRQKR
jgi:Predicted membrane protein